MAFYVDREARFYDLIRPVGTLRLPASNEISTHRIEADMRFGGTQLRPQDGVFTASSSLDFLDLSCRYVLPCSIECIEESHSQNIPEARVTLRLESDGRVTETRTQGSSTQSAEASWRFSPAHTNEGQCQSRLLVFTSLLYEFDSRSHDGDSDVFSN